MNAFELQMAPVILLAWLVWTPCLFFELRQSQSFGSYGKLLRVFLYNAAILAIFCGIWYSGFYMSENWMRIIDLGAPWSWLAILFTASFTVSFLPLRNQSKAFTKSLVGPVITTPAFWLWVIFCAIKFDPFW